MDTPWAEIFDNFGIKKVSKTDKGKKAYLPNVAQQIAIKAAGIEPAEERPGIPFTVSVLFDSETSTVEASFYHSERSDEAGREPEPRMGQEFISTWAKLGDPIVIGNIGKRLFAAKDVAATPQQLGETLARARKSNRDDTIEKAKKAKGKPKRSTRKQQDYVRNQYVIAAALIRAKGKCELPGCTSKPFRREDGTVFLEVHHVTPLAEGGVDEIGNAAAVCPMCHRELHFGKARLRKRDKLAAAIANKSF